jgi:hypothetical protein
MRNWYDDPEYMELNEKPLEEAEAVYALREAWKRIYGEYPKNPSLALLYAQSALETGRWKKMRCNNFGNIKKIHADPKRNIQGDGHYFTMFRCNEILKGKVEWFDPPHLYTHFRAYKTPTDGAEDYIKFVSQKTRYKKAWQEVLNGDPIGYCYELKKAGYYTASLEKYTKGVTSLTREFLSKKDKLLAWEPPVPEPAPPPKPEVLRPPPPPVVEPEEDVPDSEMPSTVPLPNRPPKAEEPEPKTDPEPEKPKKKIVNKTSVSLVVVVGAVIALIGSCL